MWRRALLLVVGEGRAGKTALVRALRNLPFKDTASTAGIATSTLETTNMHKWTELRGSEYDKVFRSLIVSPPSLSLSLLNIVSSKPPPLAPSLWLSRWQISFLLKDD